MGWKSTIDLTRKEALRLIFARMADVHTMSDRELGDLLEAIGYGDTMGLAYYGHNFMVRDEPDPCVGCHSLGSEYCANSCKEE